MRHMVAFPSMLWIGIMIVGMGRQTMPSSGKHVIPSWFQPHLFDPILLDDKKHDESPGTEQNGIGNGSPPQNNDSACTTKKVPRLQCGMQLPLPKVKDKYKKAEVIELAVIHNDKNATIQAIHSSDYRLGKERDFYRFFQRRMNATAMMWL